MFLSPFEAAGIAPFLNKFLNQAVLHMIGIIEYYTKSSLVGFL